MRFLLPRFLRFLVPFLPIALLGFCAVAVQIDPGGDLPACPQGPGLTLDEGFNVEEGVRLTLGLNAWAKGAATWQEVFGRKENLGPNPPFGYHLADHPPGGRLWLGLWHEAVSAVFPNSNPSQRIVVAYARLGSAAAFGLLLLLVGLVSARWYGTCAGVVSAGSLLLMPRVFGHAHLAALETVMNLTFTAAVLSVAAWWRDPEDTATRPPRFRRTAFAGLLWGLALLTKIQAVLIGPPVVLWAFWHWRGKAIGPLLVWGIFGLLVFFLGWPWLWFDPLPHAMEYFRSTTNRSTLYVWYFGERFADLRVPWHYSFVLFLTTLPVGLLILGGCGLMARDSRKRKPTGDGKLQLVVAAGLFPLLLFAIPGIAVYDGARLFLVSFPLAAMLIGRGGAVAWRWLTARLRPKLAGPIFAGFFLIQGYGLWATSPCHLSDYSLLIGGLPGAERLGMPTDYWGESLTRDFWNEVADRVPAGGTVHVTPVLHPMQLAFMQSQLPQLQAKNITLEPCIPERTREAEYLVLFKRKADLAPPILNAISAASPQIEVIRQRVRLAAFYQLGEASE